MESGVRCAAPLFVLLGVLMFCGPVIADDDWSDPIEVTLSGPAEGSRLSGRFDIRGEALAGAPIAEVQFSVAVRGATPTKWEVVPQTGLEKIGGDPAHVRFKQQVRSQMFQNGEFTVSVRALDSSIPQKISAPAMANVTLENAAPGVVLDAIDGPVSGRTPIHGSFELETVERISGILVLVMEHTEISANAELDRASGRFSAVIDFGNAPDGRYSLRADVTYDKTERTSSDLVSMEIRNSLSISALAVIGSLIAMTLAIVAMVAIRVIESRRLRSAGLDTGDVVRESFVWRLRRAFSRNRALYGLTKHESGGSDDSIHTIDAVSLEKRTGDGPGWATKIHGKLTWRRAGTTATATVFQVEDWKDRRALPLRLLGLSKKGMKKAGLEEMMFELKSDDRAEEAKAAALETAGAMLKSESGGKGGRVREFVLRR